MPSQDDNIKLNRTRKKKEPEIVFDEESVENDDNLSLGFFSSYPRTSKVVSLFLMFFSLFTFFALISYSPSDESKIQIGFFDVIKLIFGNEEVRQATAGIKNWLGVFGAYWADILYNGTIGFCVIALPYFIFTASIEIFRHLTVSEKFLKRFSVYVLLAVFIASFFGSMHNMEWFGGLPKEFTGSIGLFISGALGSLISNFGAMLFFILCITVTLYLGTNLKIDRWIHKSLEKLESATSKTTNMAKEKISAAIATRNAKEEETETITENPVKTATVTEHKSHDLPRSEEDYEEIANIIKKNVSEEAEKTSIDPAVLKNEVASIKITPNELSYASFEIPEDDDIHTEKDEWVKPVPAPGYIPPAVQEELRDYADREEEDNGYPEEYEAPVNQQEPKLTIDVVENEEDEILLSPLSTAIHEEKINYKPPYLGLLKPSPAQAAINDEELKEKGRILQDTLETFGINISNLTVTPGPVVTQYEFFLGTGIRVSKIEGLATNLALALKAKGVRISTIPDKGTVAVEVPNIKPQLVTFGSLVNSRQFLNSEHQLPLALGKTISGEVFIADLAKMPHLLIAGATGSGKSVGINTILTSLLYKKQPDELKFILIDPKRVELQQYKALQNHFLATSPEIKNTIITDPQEAILILKAAVLEMEERYEVLAKAGQRNVADYNARVKDGRIDKQGGIKHRMMPYIVIIIDELADLIITASKEIEEPIIRLAQMARAIGIHLILATQRPTTNVITGLIKSNVPARIGYMVASSLDSRTILDENGAETLIGNGDMLFLTPGVMQPVRLQNSFISTDEVDGICDFIGAQRGYSKPYLLPKVTKKGDGYDLDESSRDPMFYDAAKVVIENQSGSVSLIQRHLRIGYNRASILMDELERAGVVGGLNGAKPRAVLMESVAELHRV